MNLKNYKPLAMITGASKRLGREIAYELAKTGYNLIIHFNNSKKEAEKLSEEIEKKFSVKCETVQCDLRDIDSSKKMIKAVIKKHPELNLLVNNASIFDRSKFLEPLGHNLEDNLKIHFISPLILSHEFAKNIFAKKNPNAQIINILDKNIARYDTSYFYYLLTKKFLSEFTKMVALEVAPYVRVNGIAPGAILSSVNEKNPHQEIKKLSKINPLKKMGNPQNICNALNFLIHNDFVNGQIISIDGGASLNHAG